MRSRFTDPELREEPTTSSSGSLLWIVTAAICGIGTISYLVTSGAPRIHLHDPDAAFRTWLEAGRELGFAGVRLVSLVGLISAILCGTSIGRRLAIRGGALPKGALMWGVLVSYLAPWAVVACFSRFNLL